MPQWAGAVQIDILDLVIACIGLVAALKQV